jgi:hypothetical protein
METKKVTVYLVMRVDNRKYADVCLFDVPENFDIASYKKAALKVDWLVNKLFATIKKKIFTQDTVTPPDELRAPKDALDERIENIIEANRSIYGTDDDEPYLKLVPLTGFQIPKWGKDNPRE